MSSALEGDGQKFLSLMTWETIFDIPKSQKHQSVHWGPSPMFGGETNLSQSRFLVPVLVPLFRRGGFLIFGFCWLSFRLELLVMAIEFQLHLPFQTVTTQIPIYKKKLLQNPCLVYLGSYMPLSYWENGQSSGRDIFLVFKFWLVIWGTHWTDSPNCDYGSTPFPETFVKQSSQYHPFRVSSPTIPMIWWCWGSNQWLASRPGVFPWNIHQQVMKQRRFVPYRKAPPVASWFSQWNYVNIYNDYILYMYVYIQIAKPTLLSSGFLPVDDPWGYWNQAPSVDQFIVTSLPGISSTLGNGDAEIVDGWTALRVVPHPT